MKPGVPVSDRLTLPLLCVHSSRQLQCCLPLAYSGCKKFQLDTLEDVICTCPVTPALRRRMTGRSPSSVSARGPFLHNHKGNINSRIPQPGSAVWRHRSDGLPRGHRGSGVYQPCHGHPGIARERGGSSSNPVLNGRLHYPLPPDIDKPLNDGASEKNREYRDVSDVATVVF